MYVHGTSSLPGIRNVDLVLCKFMHLHSNMIITLSRDIGCKFPSKQSN